MRRLLSVVFLVVATGCGHTQAAPAPSSPPGGQPFLPQWYNDLAHGAPSDTACHPSTVEELLLPCDRG